MIVRAVSRAILSLAITASNEGTSLRQAFDALKQGGNAMGTLNAANEVAVEHFLNNKISFLNMP
jgi:1-deoxy-D-xylulose 5-phosphate reductoisomerase